MAPKPSLKDRLIKGLSDFGDSVDKVTKPALDMITPKEKPANAAPAPAPSVLPQIKQNIEERKKAAE